MPTAMLDLPLMTRSGLALRLALLATALPTAAQTPLLTVASPNEVQEGNFGVSVSGAGDLDGDGASDLVVGAPGESVGATGDAGHAYVFSGADGALLHQLTSPDPQGSGRFGAAVAIVGDVDVDGFADVLVGAPSEDIGAVSSAGRGYVFSGLTGALLYTLASPNVQDGGNFGGAVAGVSDADGNGVPDLLVGAFAEGPDAAGRSHLYSGTSGALLYTLASPSEEPGGNFGIAVAGTGDLDGDGRGDLLVGATGERGNRGQAHAFSGATGAPLRTRFSPNGEPGGGFGVSVAGVGDANGDGVPDVLVGAQGEDVGGIPEAGRAYLYSGATGALLRTLRSPTPAEVGSFGASVAGVGDQNGDGRADLAVGAYSEEGGGVEEAGQVHVFSGGTGRRLSTLASPAPTRFGFFGIAMAPGGDVNGDGATDLVVGASRETPVGSPVGAGRAHVIGGNALGAAAAVDVAQAVVAGGGQGAEAAILSEAQPNPFSAQARFALALAEGERVSIAVYDALGRRVAVLHDGEMEAGPHALVLDASSLPPGVYVVRATGETFTATRRVALAR